MLEFSAAQLVAGGNIVPAVSRATTVGPSNTSIVFDSADNCYIVSTGNGSINEWDAGHCGDGAPNWSIVGSNVPLDSPFQINVDTSNNLFVASALVNVFVKYNSGVCTHGTSPCNLSPNLSVNSADPFYGIAMDPEGFIYGSHKDDHIHVYTSTGVLQNSITGLGFVTNLQIQTSPIPTPTPTATATGVATPTATATATPLPNLTVNIIDANGKILDTF